MGMHYIYPLWMRSCKGGIKSAQELYRFVVAVCRKLCTSDASRSFFAPLVVQDRTMTFCVVALHTRLGYDLCACVGRPP
jgi:hypothetical protein